jgi:hypothetical protein
MKYFTRQWWLDLQQPPDRHASDEECARIWDEYRNNLISLGGRVSAESLAFFAEADVHDGQLVELRVAQPAERVAWNGTIEAEHPVEVQLTVREERGENTWTLKYSRVRRVLVDYPSEDPLFPIGGEGFGDWGYHELTDAGGGFLRHEVLFATGATLTIEFINVTVDRLRVDAAGAV